MRSKKEIFIDRLIFFVLLGCYLAVTLFLFHRQTVNYGGKYTSDIAPYIAHMQGIDTGYSFPYPVLFLMGRLFLPFTTPEHAMAFALTGLNGLSAIFLKLCLDRGLGVREDTGRGRGLVSTLFTFSLLLVSMLYSPFLLGNGGGYPDFFRYKGVFSPNPWHNATYLAARPFSIVSFFLFARLLEVYEKEEAQPVRLYVLFSGALLVTTMAKPSFTLAFVSAAGAVMLWRLGKSRLRGFRGFLCLGLCFIPTFADLLYQFFGVFGGRGDKGIGFGFLRAWSTAAERPAVSLLLGLAFPLLTLAFHLKRLRENALYRLSWQLLAVSLLMLVFLYEKGYRLPHVNFAWGYMCGMFFVFVTSVLALAEDTLGGEGRPQRLGRLALQWGVFGLHLLCGIDYFRVLLEGGLYL